MVGIPKIPEMLIRLMYERITRNEQFGVQVSVPIVILLRHMVLLAQRII